MCAGGEALDATRPVSAAYEDARSTRLSAGVIGNAGTIRRPDRFAVPAPIRGQPVHGSSFEVQDPHVILAAAGDVKKSETPAVRREPRRLVHGGWRLDRRFAAIAIDPHRQAGCAASAGVHERAIRRHVQHRSDAAEHRELLKHRHRCAGDRPRLEIERHGLQDSVCHVHEVTAFDVPRGGSPADEDLPVAGLEVQQRNLWGTAGSRRRREQHGPSAGQAPGREMVGFSAFLVGPCQDGHLAAARRDTLQSRRPIGRGEHDRVVVQPRHAAHRPIDLGNGDRRPPFNATLMSELPSVYATN